FSSPLSRSTRWAFVSVAAIEPESTHCRSVLSRGCYVRFSSVLWNTVARARRSIRHCSHASWPSGLHPPGARHDTFPAPPPGGVLNTCYNALDLHIERGRGKQRALVYDSPVTSTVKVFTYDELRDAVARVAGALRRQGIAKGDRVIIYMPMVPEAVMAMLACARIGAIHSVVFGGFAP